MKKLMTAGIALIMTAMLSIGAFALEVPTGSVVQNLNGVQQYIKTYTVSPETDPATLIEEPFTYEGYTYTYSDMTKQENPFSDSKAKTETVTVTTDRNDLNDILEALEPTLEYDDGTYSGTLSLDHTSIQTESASKEFRSKVITATTEIGHLDCNDMSYVPSTTVKDGLTLALSSVDWQVQSTVLVDDLLVPATYKAVAVYSGKAYYYADTSFVSTAEYKGTVSCNGIRDITYTVTYVGTPLRTAETPAPAVTERPIEQTEQTNENPAEDMTRSSALQNAAGNRVWIYVGAGILLLALIGGGIIFAVRAANKKKGKHEYPYADYGAEEDYEERN